MEDDFADFRTSGEDDPFRKSGEDDFELEEFFLDASEKFVLDEILPVAAGDAPPHVSVAPAAAPPDGLLDFLERGLPSTPAGEGNSLTAVTNDSEQLELEPKPEDKPAEHRSARLQNAFLQEEEKKLNTVVIRCGDKLSSEHYRNVKDAAMQDAPTKFTATDVPPIAKKIADSLQDYTIWVPRKIMKKRCAARYISVRLSPHSTAKSNVITKDIESDLRKIMNNILKKKKEEGKENVLVIGAGHQVTSDNFIEERKKRAKEWARAKAEKNQTAQQDILLKLLGNISGYKEIWIADNKSLRPKQVDLDDDQLKETLRKSLNNLIKPSKQPESKQAEPGANQQTSSPNVLTVWYRHDPFSREDVALSEPICKQFDYLFNQARREFLEKGPTNLFYREDCEEVDDWRKEYTTKNFCVQCHHTHRQFTCEFDKACIENNLAPMGFISLKSILPTFQYISKIWKETSPKQPASGEQSKADPSRKPNRKNDTEPGDYDSSSRAHLGGIDGNENSSSGQGRPQSSDNCGGGGGANYVNLSRESSEDFSSLSSMSQSSDESSEKDVLREAIDQMFKQLVCDLDRDAKTLEKPASNGRKKRKISDLEKDPSKFAKDNLCNRTPCGYKDCSSNAEKTGHVSQNNQNDLMGQGGNLQRMSSSGMQAGILEVIRQMRPDRNKISQKSHMAKSLEEHLYKSAQIEEEYLERERLQVIAHGLEIHRSTSSGAVNSHVSQNKRNSSSQGNDTQQLQQFLAMQQGNNMNQNQGGMDSHNNNNGILGMIGGNGQNNMQMDMPQGMGGGMDSLMNSMSQNAGNMMMKGDNSNYQDRMVAQKKKVTRQQKKHLLLLRHASKCKEGSNCKTKFCAQMTPLWKHMKKCRDKNCMTPHCLSSRCLLNHFRISKSQGSVANVSLDSNDALAAKPDPDLPNQALPQLNQLMSSFGQGNGHQQSNPQAMKQQTMQQLVTKSKPIQSLDTLVSVASAAKKIPFDGKESKEQDFGYFC